MITFSCRPPCVCWRRRIKIIVEAASPCRSSSRCFPAHLFSSSVHYPSCRRTVHRRRRPLLTTRHHHLLLGSVGRCHHLLPLTTSPRRLPWGTWTHRRGGVDRSHGQSLAAVVVEKTPCRPWLRCERSDAKARAPCPRGHPGQRQIAYRGSPCGPWTPSLVRDSSHAHDPGCSASKIDWACPRGHRGPVDPDHARHPGQPSACRCNSLWIHHWRRACTRNRGDAWGPASPAWAL